MWVTNSITNVTRVYSSFLSPVHWVFDNFLQKLRLFNRIELQELSTRTPFDAGIGVVLGRAEWQVNVSA